MGGKIWLLIEIFAAACMTLTLILKFGLDYFGSKSKRSLKGQVVVLTNCSHPLMSCLAIQLAVLHKCKVVCVDGDKDYLNNLVNEIKEKDDDLIIDSFVWSASEQAEHLLTIVSQYYTVVDMLITGEGLKEPSIIQPKNVKETIDLLSNDLTSHFKLPLAFLPSMLDRDEGHMVTISSCAQERDAEKILDKNPLRGRNGEITETLFDNLYEQNYKVRHTRVQTTSDNYLVKKNGHPEKIAAEIIDGIQLNKRHIRTPGLKVRVRSCIASGLRAVSQLTISDSAS